MKNLSEEILARYYDGELKEAERKRVEEILASSADHRLALDRMDRIGDLIRMNAEEGLANISLDGFDKRVMNSLEKAPAPGLGERMRVWWSEFLEHRKSIWIPAASLAGAAAAVLLVLPLLSGPPPQPSPGMEPSGGLWQAAAGQTQAPGGSEVMIVNRGQASGYEYKVLNDRGEAIGVAWIND